MKKRDLLRLAERSCVPKECVEEAAKRVKRLDLGIKLLENALRDIEQINRDYGQEAAMGMLEIFTSPPAAILEVVRRGRAARIAERSFRWIAILLPKRMRDEEVGDALEDLHCIIDDPTCPNVSQAVLWKVISTWFWLLWHAVGRISAAIRGKTTG